MNTAKDTTHAIGLTDGAVEELQRIMNEQNLDGSLGLRVGVKGGGCSGLSYILGFDKEKEDDQVYDVKGIKVMISQAHEMYLHGMEIDYHEGLDNRGFVFNNPNATETCGCGSSFA
jgi:iron-sulfur cluster assembly protein